MSEKLMRRVAAIMFIIAAFGMSMAAIKQGQIRLAPKTKQPCPPVCYVEQKTERPAFCPWCNGLAITE